MQGNRGMRKIYFLFPGMNLNVGGHLAQVKLLEVAKNLCPAEAVTYETQEEGTRFLNSILEQDDTRNAIFFIHWGPHVPDLINRLAEKNVVYVSYSTGYGFKIPPRVPILAGSRHTQAYWGRQAPDSLIYHLPGIISDEFKNLHRSRDIDVLVQKRKSSRYLLEELVPELERHCSVLVLDSWVDDLAAVFNRSKVYLYDSSDYWSQHGLSEGFGLPPLEALACGCVTFSSINDALSDYLDPGFNCQKLRVYSKQYDVERILSAVSGWQEKIQENDPAAEYRGHSVEKRLGIILSGLNDFFDHQALDPNAFETANVYAEDRNAEAVNKPSLPEPVLKMGRILPAFVKKWIKALLFG